MSRNKTQQLGQRDLTAAGRLRDAIRRDLDDIDRYERYARRSDNRRRRDFFRRRADRRRRSVVRTILLLIDLDDRFGREFDRFFTISSDVDYEEEYDDYDDYR